MMQTSPLLLFLCTPLSDRLFLDSGLSPLLPLLSPSHGVADCEIIPVVDGAPFSTVPFVPPRLSCDTHSAHSLEFSFLYGGKDESFVPEFPFGKALTYYPIIPDEVEVCYVQPEISFPFPTPAGPRGAACAALAFLVPSPNFMARRVPPTHTVGILRCASRIVLNHFTGWIFICAAFFREFPHCSWDLNFRWTTPTCLSRNWR